MRNAARMGQFRVWCLLVTLIALPALGWPAPARADVFPLAPDFTGAAVPANWVLGGGAVLTGNGVVDPVGAGWLRLTAKTRNLGGWAYYNVAFPSDRGLVVTFDYTAWGGTGGQGLTFFLFDGATTSFYTGGWGGSLGYSLRLLTNGLSNGYLGLGIDEFGDYSNPTEGRIGGPGRRPDSVAIRGPGSGLVGYAYLVGTGTLPTSIDVPSVGTRPSQTGTAYRHCELTLEPVGGSYWVSVKMQFGAGQPLQQVIAPTLISQNPPATLRMGFTGGTGGLTNYHEVRNLSVTAAASPTTLTGVVRDAVTNQPIPGASVLVTDAAGNVRNATSDATGAWSLSSETGALVPGTASVAVSHAGYCRTTLSVNLARGVPNNADATLQPATITGVISDLGTAAPLVGATVVLTDTLNVAHTTTSGLGGAYTFANSLAEPIALGNVTVRATKNRYQAAQTSLLLAACGPNVANLALGTTDLWVFKSDGHTQVAPGALLTYTITLENRGSIAAAGIVITDSLRGAPYLGFVSATPGYTQNLTHTVWHLPGSLAVGASTQVTIVLRMAGVLPNGATELENYAVASTASPEADTTNNEQSDINTVIARPNLTLRKTVATAPVPVGLNQTIAYTLTVANLGSAVATGVVISDQLDALTTYVPGSAALVMGGAPQAVTVTQTSPTLVIQFPPMPPGAEGALTYRVITTGSLPPGTETIHNLATVLLDQVDADPTNNSQDVSLPAQASIVDLWVTKLAVPVPEPAQPGGLIYYTLRFGNRGNTAATAVTLADQLPAHVTVLGGSVYRDGVLQPGVGPFTGPYGWNYGLSNVAPGYAGVLSFTVAISDVLPANVFELVNAVTITGTNGDALPASNAAAITTTLSAHPELRLAKSDGLDQVNAGDTVTYIVNYWNEGNRGATGVVLTDTLLQGLTYVPGSASPMPASVVGNTLRWNLGTVPVGGPYTVTLWAVVNVTGLGASETHNHAMIASDGLNGAEDNSIDNLAEDTTRVRQPNLTLRKSAQPQALPIGANQVITYTLTGDNRGDALATGVVISDQLDALTTYVPGSVLLQMEGSTYPVTVTQTSPVLVVELPDMPPGIEGTLTYRVVTAGSLPPGTTAIRNLATVLLNEPDADPTSNSQAVDVPTRPGVDLWVTKLAVPEPEPAVPGGLIHYVLHFGNRGNTTATAVTLSESVPNQATLLQGTVYRDGMLQPGIGPFTGPYGWNYNLNDVAAGTSGTLSFAMLIGDVLPANTLALVNEAMITGTNGDLLPASNIVSATTTINAHPELRLAKSDGLDEVNVGETVTYTLTGWIEGNRGASGVVLTDTLSPGLTYVPGSASLAPSSINGNTLVWNLGNLSVGGPYAVTLRATVLPIGPAGALIHNQALISSDGHSGAEENLADNYAVDTTRVRQPNLTLRKSAATAPMPVGANQVITYTLTGANLGDAIATGVVISDQLDALTTYVPGSAALSLFGVNYPVTIAQTSPLLVIHLPTMPPGIEGTLTYRVVTASSLPLGTTAIHNVATVLLNEVDADPSNNSQALSLPAQAGVDLWVTKVAVPEPAPAMPGGLIRVTMHYGNRGNTTATAVTLVEQVTAHATVLKGTIYRDGVLLPDLGPFVGPILQSFPLGDMAPATSHVLSLTAEIDDVLPANMFVLTNTVTITGTNGDLLPISNSHTEVTLLSAHPELRLAKTDGLDQVNAGDMVTYTVNYWNEGDRGASGVVLTEDLAEGLTYIAGSANPAPDEVAGDDLTWNLGIVPVGGPYTITLRATVDDTNLVSSLAANEAEIESDGINGTEENLEDNCAIDITHVVRPYVVLSKTAQEPVAVGQLVTFTIDYRNLATAPALNLVLTDTLPAECAFVSASAAGVHLGGGVVHWAGLGDLAALGNGSVQVVARLVGLPSSDGGVPPSVAQTLRSDTVVITSTNTLVPSPWYMGPLGADQPEPSLRALGSGPDLNGPADWHENPHLAHAPLYGAWPAPVPAFVEGVYWYPESDLEAQWVAASQLGNVEPNYSFYRHRFYLPLNAMQPEATLTLAADDLAEAYLNRVYIGQDYGAGGPSTVIDTTAAQPGVNLLAVRLLNNDHGGHAAYPNAQGIPTCHQGLLYELRVQYDLRPFVLAAPVVRAGQSLSLTLDLNALGEATAPLVPTISYGDGSAETGSTSHVYDAEGTYTVTVWVADAAGGVAYDTFGVTVMPAYSYLVVNRAEATYRSPSATYAAQGGIAQTTSLGLRPVVTLDKRLDTLTLQADGSRRLTYAITISTTGPLVDVLPLVDVYDPEEMTYLSAVPAPDVVPYPGLLAWDDLTGPAPSGLGRDLTLGQPMTVYLTFSVAPTVTVVITNTAYVVDALDGDGQPIADASAAAAVDMDAAGMLVATPRPWHDPLCAGWKQRWTFGFTNATGQTLTNATLEVTLGDLPPSLYQLLLAESSAGAVDLGGGRVRWPLGTLAAGATAKRELELRVFSSAPAGSQSACVVVSSDQRISASVCSSAAITPCGQPEPTATATLSPTATPTIAPSPTPAAWNYLPLLLK